LKIGNSVGLFADVHGAIRVMSRALEVCRGEGVETIVLLGDLFDRPEQADPCAEALAGWQVVGVYCNHERELAEAAVAGGLVVRPETTALLTGLSERFEIGDMLFTHEVERWAHADPLTRVLGRSPNGHDDVAQSRVTFAGHTHYRLARDERGPIDVARGTLVLDPQRRYLINPGAMSAGQFAILDRGASTVYFRHVEW
jgi:predicted phosphodiesterase